MNTLKIGDSGEDVRTWQLYLTQHGFPDIVVDGAFGNKTKLATMAWQQRNGLADDGIVGPATWLASGISESPEPPKQAEPPSKPPDGKMDARSEAIIATLNPHIQDDFRNLGLAINKAIAPKSWKWISGFRGEAEQNEIYAQGRTKPGSIVTNARFPFSAHNSGFAADGGVFTASGEYLDESPEYDVAIHLSRKMGFHPGADFGDRPHHCKRPPSLDTKTETVFINEMARRIENGLPYWP